MDLPDPAAARMVQWIPPRWDWVDPLKDIQAQVLDLLQELQDEDGLSYLFISHDMAVVDQVADRVMVLRLGQVMEEGPRESVLHDPRHHYTRRLLSAVPVPDPSRHRPLLPPAPDGQSPVLPLGESFQRVRLETVRGHHRVATTG